MRGSEVVDPDLNTGLPQRRQDTMGRLGIVHQHTFGELESEMTVGNATLGERALDLLEKAGIRDLASR